MSGQVYIVNVFHRVDGLYVFAEREDAEGFAAAIGHDDWELTDAPVIAGRSVSALVDAERAS